MLSIHEGGYQPREGISYDNEAIFIIFAFERIGDVKRSIVGIIRWRSLRELGDFDIKRLMVPTETMLAP